ncbi:MAG TPA: hypothetical protein VJ020_11670 [Anaerolineales bacterium]|nr:hypothetical protein [Anaerolineales bacterium]
MALPQRAVINLAPQHKFKSLSKWPEAQLMLLMPRVLWNRARLYVPHFEAVNLAGRFGADPGDYEWEVISEPQGFKWWRRTISGDAAYCAFIVAPDVSIDPVEVFGIIDIASDSPWWFEGIDDLIRIEMRGDTLARQRKITEHEAKVIISLRDEYAPRKMITAAKDENGLAWRVGSPEEVEKLKETFVGLANRARTAVLPDEARTGTGPLMPQPVPLKPSTGQLKPPTGPLRPQTDQLEPKTDPLRPQTDPRNRPTDQPKPGTGSLKDALGSLLKPKTDQLKKE